MEIKKRLVPSESASSLLHVNLSQVPRLISLVYIGTISGICLYCAAALFVPSFSSFHEREGLFFLCIKFSIICHNAVPCEMDS